MLTPARASLTHILHPQHGNDALLNTLAEQAGQRADRRDVRYLIQREQQGSLKTPGRGGDGKVDRVRTEPVQQRGDQRRELLLNTRRRDHVQRALLGDQLPKIDLRCDGWIGGRSDRRAGGPRERDLRSPEHRGTVVTDGLRGDPGKLLQRDRRIRFAEDLRGLGELRASQPSAGAVDPAVRERRRVKQWREQRPGGDREVLTVTDALIEEAGDNNAAATSTAPSHVSHRDSGEKPTLTSGQPSEPVGSYTATGPRRARCAALCRMSPLVEVTSAGPAQHASVGAITFLVLPALGGPTMIAAQSAGVRSTPSAVRPAHTCVPAMDAPLRAIHGSSGSAGGAGTLASLALWAAPNARVAHRPPAVHPAKLTSVSNSAIMASAGGRGASGDCPVGAGWQAMNAAAQDHRAAVCAWARVGGCAARGPCPTRAI